MKKNLRLLLLVIFTLSLVSCKGTGGAPEVSEKEKIIKAEEDKKKTMARKAFTYRQDKDLDSLTFGLLGEDGNYNPFYFESDSDEKVVSFLFRKLFYTEIDGMERKITPVLAKDVEVSEDLRTYRIVLDDNASWQDKEPIRARDLDFTLRNILEDEKANLNLDFKKYGEISYEIIDDYNFEIKLDQPSYSFLFDLEKIYPVPKHIFKEDVEKVYNFENIKDLVGSSPYKFKDAYIHETYKTKTIELAYEGEENPPIKTLILRYSADRFTNRFDLEDYNLNFGLVDQNMGDHFINNEIYNTLVFEEGYDSFILFKQKSKDASDPEFRQAIAKYVYKTLVPNHYGMTDFVIKADSVFSPSTIYYSPRIKFNQTILNKEIDYMRKKILVDGYNPINFSFYALKGSREEGIAIVLQEAFRADNIDFKLSPLFLDEQEAVVRDPNVSDYDFLIFENKTMKSPYDYVKFYREDLLPLSGEGNEEIVKLFEEADRELDPVKRNNLYCSLQDKLLEAAFIYPYVNVGTQMVVDERLDLSEAIPLYDSYVLYPEKIKVMDVDYGLEEYDFTEKDLLKNKFDSINIKR